MKAIRREKLSKFVTMVTSIEAQRMPYYKPLDANNSSGFR